MTTTGPRTVRAPRGDDPVVPQLADRGGAADADEQPRSGGRRGPRQPRRVRRHGSRRPIVGSVRRDLLDAARARRRRDAARPVGQAGRSVPHQRVGAAGAPRQLQPRSRVGELDRVPPPRVTRPDDVRADDRRLVDLHRHPGDPPGHVRVLRRDRPAQVRWIARRDDHRHRRARRNGRRPTAGDHDERRRGAVRRRRPRSDRQAHRASLPRRGRRLARRRRRPLPRRP